MFYFCACPIQNVIKHDANGKKGQAVMLQMPFWLQIKANLANIQPENL